MGCADGFANEKCVCLFEGSLVSHGYSSYYLQFCGIVVSILQMASEMASLVESQFDLASYLADMMAHRFSTEVPPR